VRSRTSRGLDASPLAAPGLWRRRSSHPSGRAVRARVSGAQSRQRPSLEIRGFPLGPSPLSLGRPYPDRPLVGTANDSATSRQLNAPRAPAAARTCSRSGVCRMVAAIHEGVPPPGGAVLGENGAAARASLFRRRSRAGRYGRADVRGDQPRARWPLDRVAAWSRPVAWCRSASDGAGGVVRPPWRSDSSVPAKD